MSIMKLERPDEVEIGALLDEYAEAVRSTDIGRILDYYDDDIVAFDAIGPLRLQGREGYRKHWETALSYLSGTMVFEVHELSVTAEGGTAFGHYLCRCGCIDDTGKAQIGWMRASVGLRKRSGQWLIAHEHFSAPFEPESGKAVFDQEP